MEIIRILMSGKPLTCLVSMFFSPFLTHSINHPYSQLSQQHRGDVVITGKSIWALLFLSFCPLFIAYTILKRILTYSHQLGGASREASGGVSVIYAWYHHILYSHFSHIHPYCQHLANAECHLQVRSFDPSKFG